MYYRRRLDFKRGDEEVEEIPIQESSVLVVFDLPDGSQGESEFKLGHTVEVLKSFVESEYGIPMASQDMFIEEKHMLDPLSLLDYPEAKGESEVYIRVEGPLPSESKKWSIVVHMLSIIAQIAHKAQLTPVAMLSSVICESQVERYFSRPVDIAK